MDNWTAFFCGLILGSDNKNTHHYYGPKKIRNIALQDIAFCQALRNSIDRLESFVTTMHPTPKKFIERFYPDYHFTEPFTSEEQKKISERERGIKDYLWWVEIIGEEEWNSLSIIEKIWQTKDLTHVPDPDNLDLLFALDDYATPVKHNGRVYEYEPIEIRNAKGFWESNPSKMLYTNCYETAKHILERNGFEYDYTRFEYNKSLATSKIPENQYKTKKLAWEIDSRKQEYLNLLKAMPSFIVNPWSDLTREIKQQHELDEEYVKQDVANGEKQRRHKELHDIYVNLSSFQKDRMVANTPMYERKADLIFGVLCFIPVLWFIIGLIIGSTMDYDAKKDFDYLFLLILFALIIVVGLFYGIDKIVWERKEKIYLYLRLRQKAYYSSSEHKEYKKEYEELLNQKTLKI